MILNDELLLIRQQCLQLDLEKIRKQFPQCDLFASKLGQIQNHEYSSPAIAIVALIHRSSLIHWPKNRQGIVTNERLEFLGDACLGFVLAQQAMIHYPGVGEGELSRLRSVLAGTDWLAEKSLSLGLGELLLMGKGENGEVSVPKTNALADVFESTCAALLVDAGYEKARDWILESCCEDLVAGNPSLWELDVKTKFQQWVQSIIGQPPTYRTVSESLVTNNNSFEVCGLIGDVEFARACGPTKRDASKRVAQIGQSMVDNLTLTAEIIMNYKNRKTM